MSCIGLSLSRRTGIVLFVVLLMCVLAAPPARAAEADSLDDLKDQADRWLDLERRIADENNQWRTEKEVLTSSIGVLQQEQVALRGKLEANEVAAGLFTTRWKKAESELAGHEAAHHALLVRCDAYEQRLRALAPRLPDPLRERIEPMLAKLAGPAGEDAPSVADRTQALVSILSAIDQFNNALTLTHQFRADPGGEPVDFKVLYWGLALACAIDARGQHAWLLSPGANGWEWHEAPEHAGTITSLIAIYEKQQSPVLLALPVSGKGSAQ